MKLPLFTTTVLVILALCDSSGSFAATTPHYGNPAQQDPNFTYLAQAEENLEVEKLFFVEFPEMIFSADSTNSKYRFIRFTHIIEASDEEGASMIRSKIPDILDDIHEYFRNERPDVFAGPDGVYRLKEVLFELTSDVMQPIPIQDVLIQELLVQ